MSLLSLVKPFIHQSPHKWDKSFKIIIRTHLQSSAHLDGIDIVHHDDPEVVHLDDVAHNAGDLHVPAADGGFAEVLAGHLVGQVGALNEEL